MDELLDELCAEEFIRELNDEVLAVELRVEEFVFELNDEALAFELCEDDELLISAEVFADSISEKLDLWPIVSTARTV